MSKNKINKTSVETRLAIERRSAAMLPDRPTLEGLKPWDIKRALFEAIISGKGASLMGELDRIVDEFNEVIDLLRIKSGSLTVSASSWTGEEMPRATVRVQDISLSGFVMFLSPADDETKRQAGRSRVSVEIDKTSNGGWYADVVLTCEDRPSSALNFRYHVLPTESEEDAIVALVGVDAYGADSEKVSEAIRAALVGYAPKEHNHDGVYLKQHQSLDHLVKIDQGASNAGKILMVGADGKIIVADIPATGDIIGYVEGTQIVLSGDLAPGDYTFAYLVKNPDGTTETVTIGAYTVEDETETKTYTVKWVNYDGTVLETDTVTEGVTPAYDGATPIRAADDQYTYTFNGWDKTVVAATADATYTATYTQTAKPTELPYTNLLDGVIIEQNKKMSTSSGTSATQDGACATDFIAIPAERVGEVFRIYNVSLHVNERVNNILFYDESKTKLGAWAGVAGAFSGNVVVKNGVYYFTPNLAYANVRYIRFSCGVIDSNSIVTLGEEIA